ncbi:hypothetical protein [Longitalea luteola]|uniref:hypothetical protein n=1 Tax=Longitalea luteola TaxID=2812563 RepID=UPI001A97571A|nr:hypothetical protein [Longitalea luteola]
MSTTPLTALPPKQPALIRALAHFFSCIFHPLFLPAYVTAFLLFIDPYAFAGINHKYKIFRLISVFFNTAVIPGFAVFLMWRLKLVQSMQLRTQKERIIPYAAAMIFYFWAWYVFHSQKDNPQPFLDFLLGSFLAVCAAWFLNIVTKVSMHAIGVGGLAVFFLLQAFNNQDVTGVYFSFAILIAGVVCTSRLIVSDHSQREIYLGLFAGALCQLLAMWLQ